MYAKYALPVLGATLARAQTSDGAGEGYPPPPPQTLATTKSGVLPVLPTESAAFTGVEINEGAIVYDGLPNPTFQPVNGPATSAVGLPMATYQAMLPSTNFDNGLGTTVTGNIMISSNPSTPGVMISVDFSGFPDVTAYGPFVYHIHTLPVPADGNCSATMGHLDPTNRGEYYPCNPADPASCQVGDLAGKHGNITVPDFVTSYADPFLSTDPSSPAYFGDKSIVIHTSNTTRITCANFMMMGGGSNSTMPSGTMGGTGSPTYGGPVQQTGGAGALTFGGLAVAAGLVAAVL